MSPATQGDGFAEVTRGRKKRKSSNLPTLLSQSKTGSSEPPLGTPVQPKPSLKNKTPVILIGVDGKFKNWRTLMGELRQFHPSLDVSQIKELPKGDFLVIGDRCKTLSYYKANLNLRQLKVKMLRLVFLKPSKPTKHKPKVLQ